MDFKTLEEYREKYKAKFGKGLRISGIVAGVLAFFIILSAIASKTYFLIFSAIFPALFIMAFGYVISFFVARKEHEAYREAYKTYFVRASLEKVFPGCQYNHNAGISRNELAMLGMMSLGDSYSANDFVSGTYKGLNFAQSDVRITEERRDSDGDSYTVTLFSGRYAIFEFKKNFKFRLEVVGKGFGNYRVPRGTGFKKFSKIKTESGEFNKKFKVIAEDGFEAFYILDPKFIENVEKLGEMHGFKVALFFADNRLNIAIDGEKDSFEAPSPFK